MKLPVIRLDTASKVPLEIEWLAGDGYLVTGPPISIRSTRPEVASVESRPTGLAVVGQAPGTCIVNVVVPEGEPAYPKKWRIRIYVVKHEELSFRRRA